VAQDLSVSNPDYELLIEIADGRARAPRPMRGRPLLEDLGAELVSFDRSTGRVDLAFVPTERPLQGHGVVAGGVVGSMLDIAMSLPVLGVLERDTPFATASFTVNLMSAVRPGRVLASGWIERRGAKAAFCAARLTSADGRPGTLATASSTVLILSGDAARAATTAGGNR
jgi:acyl-coenzyme A thioesterase PaaI-like protein